MWWLAAAQMGMSLLSGMEEAKAQIAAAKYNNETAKMSAGMIRTKATADARQIRDQGITHLGTMRAGFAASGLQVSGSATDVLADSARKIKRDELTTRYQGELQIKMLERDTNRANMEAESSADAAIMGGVGGALGALGTGIGRSN